MGKIWPAGQPFAKACFRQINRFIRVSCLMFLIWFVHFRFTYSASKGNWICSCRFSHTWCCSGWTLHKRTGDYIQLNWYSLYITGTGACKHTKIDLFCSQGCLWCLHCLVHSGVVSGSVSCSNRQNQWLTLMTSHWLPAIWWSGHRFDQVCYRFALSPLTCSDDKN